MKRERLSRKHVRYYLSKTLDFLGQTRAKPVLLISGFYRSGTTWAQEVAADALNAKTMFEPFSALSKFPSIKQNHRQTPELYFPENGQDFYIEDLHALDRTFKGFSPYSFPYTARYRLTEALSKDVIVKVVRGHFILPYLSERYNVPVIHIRRNPFAVINSFLFTKWHWTFDDVSFTEMFPNTGLLHAYDNAQGFEKIAAFWAYAENHVKPGDTTHILHYEDLVMNDMKDLFDIIGKTSDRVNLASSVSSDGRETLDKKDRLYSWQKTLPEEKQKRIIKIIAEIAPDLAKMYEI